MNFILSSTGDALGSYSFIKIDAQDLPKYVCLGCGVNITLASVFPPNNCMYVNHEDSVNSVRRDVLQVMSVLLTLVYS